SSGLSVLTCLSSLVSQSPLPTGYKRNGDNGIWSSWEHLQVKEGESPLLYILFAHFLFFFPADPDILNGVYMSEALNPVFVDNFERDPTLTWQYFGSSTGFFRLYPGIKWLPDENGVISFDCRNRGWYIQAATSPKDIVIIVDVSGSMKGLRMTIAKHTIVTILDTLGENDFVNIIAYNDYVHFIEPCFKGILVQADRDNREHFKQLVDELQAKGVGTVNKALTESFKILREFRDAGQGGLCNQAIMLITDGAVEDYEAVFEKYNWPDRKVRVFTYLIGREVTFAPNVKWIACNNKGYYTQISTLADVQENVMEYLHVLSRPMVINHDHDIIWTEAYMDSAAQSLLLMTTVAMPVFSKKNETRSHGILLGVVGSDVPLRELLKLAPRYKLGVHGYAFLNTNNGYILSHPDLRPLYKEGKKLKPKPNYNSVDLSEVEWEDQDEILRTAMINGETGYLSMDVKVPVDKGVRMILLRQSQNACCSFLGVVLSRGHGEYILLGNTSVEEGLHDLLQPDVSLANEWIYCITDIDPDHRKLSQLEAVIRFLTGEEPDLECDEELVQEVLFDAVVTAPMEAYWTTLALNMSTDSEAGIEMAFLGTRAGLMRSALYVGISLSLKVSLKPLPDLEMYLWTQKEKEQNRGGMGTGLQSQGTGPLCCSGPFDFFPEAKVHIQWRFFTWRRHRFLLCLVSNMQTDNMLLYERTGCRGRWNNRMVVVVLSFLAGVSLSPTFSDMNHMSKAESCTVPEVHIPTATLALFLR
uniref:VWFA domain-containing protein n=1 Tax=Meleagris gallopavo TaxID=9103 RepID=A0A803XTW2_MELGA